MNKNDLIGMVADSTGLSKADAAKAVEAIFDCITESLKRGSTVRLVGFGTFRVGSRVAKSGRNPRTGETIDIPASRTVRLKWGKPLKEAVNVEPPGSDTVARAAPHGRGKGRGR